MNPEQVGLLIGTRIGGTKKAPLGALSAQNYV